MSDKTRHALNAVQGLSKEMGLPPSSIGEAKLVGTKAKELLGVPDSSGRVLAVVSDAAYLMETVREIMWLGQEQLPAHPRAILGSFDLTALKVGMSFKRQSASLCFEDRASLDLANASVWRPAAIRPEQLVRPGIVNARVRQLMDAIQTLDCGDSLGQAISLIRAIANGNDVLAVPGSSLSVTAAFQPIKEIALACRDQDTARVVQIGRALVGLGPGLTPSGDDFLGGLAFVAFHLNSVYSGELCWEHRPFEDLIDWAGARTNQISHALLRDHVCGQGVEPLHNLFTALLQGKASDEIMAHVRALLAIGSTSGWDMLVGAITGMLLIESIH